MTIATREISDAAVANLCRKWRIRRLALFGSGLSGRLQPDSDIDLLADFDPGEQWSLMDMVHGYDSVDWKRVWKTLEKDFPPLIKQVRVLLPVNEQ